MIRKRRRRFRKVGAAGLRSCVDSDKERRAERYKSLVELFHGPEQQAGSSRRGQAGRSGGVDLRQPWRHKKPERL
jgi:hypothetical protein